MLVIEKRKSLRFNVRLQGTANLRSEQKEQQNKNKVITRDVSADGAYLLTDSRPRVGNRVQVCMHWPSKEGGLGTVLETSGKVLRVEHLSKKKYGIALQFDDFPWKPKKIQEDIFGYSERLGSIKQYVEDDYSRKVTLGEASRIAAMEATYFSSFFHAKVGIPFRDWLRHTRIAKAMDLIAKRNYSLTEVAFAVGYSDLRTFERAFKKVAKVRPLEFKKSVRA